VSAAQDRGSEGEPLPDEIIGEGSSSLAGSPASVEGPELLARCRGWIRKWWQLTGEDHPVDIEEAGD
jgi:hypothetical protein